MEKWSSILLLITILWLVNLPPPEVPRLKIRVLTRPYLGKPMVNALKKALFLGGEYVGGVG